MTVFARTFRFTVLEAALQYLRFFACSGTSSRAALFHSFDSSQLRDFSHVDFLPLVFRPPRLATGANKSFPCSNTIPISLYLLTSLEAAWNCSQQVRVSTLCKPVGTRGIQADCLNIPERTRENCLNTPAYGRGDAKQE